MVQHHTYVLLRTTQVCALIISAVLLAQLVYGLYSSVLMCLSAHSRKLNLLTGSGQENTSCDQCRVKFKESTEVVELPCCTSQVMCKICVIERKKVGKKSCPLCSKPLFNNNVAS